MNAFIIPFKFSNIGETKIFCTIVAFKQKRDTVSNEKTNTGIM